MKAIKKIELGCNCGFHSIVIEKFHISNFPLEYLDIEILNHKSFKTGKILKKPILLGDVILSPTDVSKLRKLLTNE